MAGSSSGCSENEKVVTIADNEAGEETPLIGMGECRICQDSLKNLESPCACSGSLEYAHRKCVQHWCKEKGDITCEIVIRHTNLVDGSPANEASMEKGKKVLRLYYRCSCFDSSAFFYLATS